MIVFDPQKTLCPERIPKGGTTRLKIGFRASGELSEADVVLAMDRSGSMGGAALEKAVSAATSMIESLQKCGQDSFCSCMPGKSRLGLVSYADCACMEAPLETCLEPVKKALKTIKAGGNTNHQAAMELAGEMLSGCCKRKKILILFTDGKSNRGCPEPAARELREKGVEIFCIGLGVEACYLRKLASQSWKAHISLAENLCQLECAFRQTANHLTGGNLKACILERVSEEFEIVKVLPPDQGRARKLDKRTVQWTLETGEICSPEPICLHLDVRHTGCRSGRFHINESICYEDGDHNCLTFPNPCVVIEENACVPGCCCPCGHCIVADPCCDAAAGCCTETKLSGLGRIIEVKAVIKDVCPNKRVGAAVILTEVDLEGREHKLGMKTYEIPAQIGEGCRDVILNCVQFVVPETTRAWGECENLCSPRCFRARVIANYLDTDYESCESLCKI